MVHLDVITSDFIECLGIFLFTYLFDNTSTVVTGSLVSDNGGVVKILFPKGHGFHT